MNMFQEICLDAAEDIRWLSDNGKISDVAAALVVVSQRMLDELADENGELPWQK